MLLTAHLFAGAGGGILADLILGHKPVLAVEIDHDCCEILRRRREEGWLPHDMEIIEADIRDIDFSRWAGRVDQIAAGFPCQDISCAGPGTGIRGKRSGLYWEVVRAVDAIKPAIVFLENTPAIRTRGRMEVVESLVSRGYAWADGVLAAVDVGCPQRRDRWWLLAANADGLRKLGEAKAELQSWIRSCNQAQNASDLDGYRDVRREVASKRYKHDGNNPGWEEATSEPTVDPEDAARPNSVGRVRGTWKGKDNTGRTEPEDEAPSDAITLRNRLQVAVQQGWLQKADAETIQTVARHTGAYDWMPPDSGVCGVVHGMAHPVDGPSKKARITALGNGQVPLQAAAAWLILAGIV